MWNLLGGVCGDSNTLSWAPVHPVAGRRRSGGNFPTTWLAPQFFDLRMGEHHGSRPAKRKRRCSCIILDCSSARTADTLGTMPRRCERLATRVSRRRWERTATPHLRDQMTITLPKHNAFAALHEVCQLDRDSRVILVWTRRLLQLYRECSWIIREERTVAMGNICSMSRVLQDCSVQILYVGVDCLIGA